MFKFKFIREDEKYRRDRMVIAELGTIALEDPELMGTDVNQLTVQFVKDTTDRMSRHIDFLKDELIKSKALNIVLGAHLAGFYYIMLRK